ncbi:uncharacterized protein LOC135387606 [Ornithodoros turicata]|uniref:uncharacterized protein LOC135387606 n=1 Tax=Ornithodoros turicata TaxID=34597 RepID=UPI003139E080
MTSWQPAEKVEYGISRTSRVLLACTFFLFVLGGVLSVVGVAEMEPIKIYGGLIVTVIALGMYTLIVMYTRVYGPPSGFQLKGLETLAKVKPATFKPAPESQCLLILAFGLFTSGCICVIMGFKLAVIYMWIPGYCLSVVGFLVYTAAVVYGPLTIKPGALVVAFPDDNLPIPGNASVETPPEMRKRREGRKESLYETSFIGDSRKSSRRSSMMTSMFETETSVSPPRKKSDKKRSVVPDVVVRRPSEAVRGPMKPHGVPRPTVKPLLKKPPPKPQAKKFLGLF